MEIESKPESSNQRNESEEQEYTEINEPSTSQQVQIVEEVVYEDVIDEGDEIIDEYDCAINNQFEASVLFELYQPLECENGLLCRICHHMGKDLIFPDRGAYNTHRYKVHGSFNNSIPCPEANCKDAFASTIHLRRHLMNGHQLPLEMHHQVFSSVSDFDKWKSLVEMATNCRFIMHTKQPHKKRQILHCSRSEHKQVLQSRTRRLPRRRMQKEGACCPAVISYRQEERTGAVHAFYQLYHVGHSLEEDPEYIEENRSLQLYFPDPPSFVGDRPMQFIQVDFIEMDTAVYHNVIYSYVLVVTDLHTGFIWGKPMIDPITKITVQRILADLVAQFDGFATASGRYQRLIKGVMAALEETFSIQIRDIYNEPPDYEIYRSLLYEQAHEELKSINRWPEVIPFATMELNQTGKISSFERFFKRKPHTIHPPPWFPTPEFEEDFEEYNPIPPNITVFVKSRIYLKNIDFRPRGGAYQPFFFGIVEEIDFVNSPHFPYKVYYSRSEDPGPNENSPYVWVSPYDILPTNQEMPDLSNEEGQRIIAGLLCSCKEGSQESCNLFRSPVCSNLMSKTCCLLSGKKCGYHENASGDDSYTKMEKLTRFFSAECTNEERKQLKTTLKCKAPKEMYQVPPPPEPEFGMEVAGEEIVGTSRDYYESGSPPAKMKKRNPAKGGTGSIILRNTDSNQITKEIRFDEGRTLEQEEILNVDRPTSPNRGPTFTQTNEEKSFLPAGHQVEEVLEEYRPPPSERAIKMPIQEPVRRSGRNAKAKIYKDFVTE